MKKKILVVEDEFIIALDIKNILEAEGFEVITNIDNVPDALLTIETQKPNLVLIDINLSGDKNGIDLGHYMLQKDNIPYIYITSNADSTSLERAKATRPHGFIVKPFKPIDLKATVEIVLNNYRHKNLDVKRSDEKITNDTSFRIKAVITFIDKNVSRKIEISELAALTQWKTHHFIKIFTQQLNETPYQYILSQKVERSKTMIHENNMTLTDIAFEMGFLSYSNFCNTFKKATGQTPENFKKTVQIMAQQQV